jgi:hypothetical protein
MTPIEATGPDFEQLRDSVLTAQGQSPAGYTQPAEPSVAERVQQLAQLRDQGLITEAEFRAMRAQLLEQVRDLERPPKAIMSPAVVILGVFGCALLIAALCLGFGSIGGNCGAAWAPQQGAGPACEVARGYRLPWAVLSLLLGLASSVSAGVVRALANDNVARRWRLEHDA